MSSQAGAYNNKGILSSVLTSNSTHAGLPKSINSIPYDKVTIYSCSLPRACIVRGIDNEMVRIVSRRYIPHEWSREHNRCRYAHSASVDVVIGTRSCRAFVSWDPNYRRMPMTRINLSIAAAALTPAELLQAVDSIIPAQCARVGCVECKLDLAGIGAGDAMRMLYLKNGRDMRRYGEPATYYCGSSKSPRQFICYDKGAERGLDEGQYTRIEMRQRIDGAQRPTVEQFARGEWSHRHHPFEHVRVADDEAFQRLHPLTRKAFIRKGLHKGLRDYQRRNGVSKAGRMKKDLLKPFTELMDAWDALRAAWHASAPVPCLVYDTSQRPSTCSSTRPSAFTCPYGAFPPTRLSPITVRPYAVSAELISSG